MPCDRKIGPYECCSVVQGDCLELMKAIPSEIFRCECGEDVSGEGGVYHIAAGHKMKDGKPFDAVITDPPFSQYTHSNAKSNRDLGHGNKAIDFGAIDFGAIERTFAMLSEKCSRWLIATMDWRHIAEMAKKPPNGWEFVRFGVWVKMNPMPQISSDRPANGWDGILYMHKVDRRKEWSGGGSHGNWIGSVITNGDHPTGKPLDLCESWVGRFTAEGDCVLDPFAGSGTTLVAAKKLGRHFLGFEISEEYCKIARDRIARVEAQPTLFEPKPEQMNLLDTAKDLK